MGNVFMGWNQPRTSYGGIGSNRPCPKCRGSGVVRESEGGDQGFVDSEGGGLANEYIALIPLSDWRLRPRRTALKITVAVLLCLLISALLLFFLLLRSIHVFSNSPLITPPGVLIDQDSAIVSINITNPFNITNANYIPIHVERVSMRSLYHNTVINETKTVLDVWIPARTTRELSVDQSLVFKGSTFSDYLPNLCLSNNTEFNRIYIRFGIEIVAEALGQRVEAILDTFQLVSCHPLQPNTTTSSTHQPPRR